MYETGDIGPQMLRKWHESRKQDLKNQEKTIYYRNSTKFVQQKIQETKSAMKSSLRRKYSTRLAEPKTWPNRIIRQNQPDKRSVKKTSSPKKCRTKLSQRIKKWYFYQFQLNSISFVFPIFCGRFLIVFCVFWLFSGRLSVFFDCCLPFSSQCPGLALKWFKNSFLNKNLFSGDCDNGNLAKQPRKCTERRRGCHHW